ncbi:MAG: FecR domain-containing protein [Patescibacteria group bacterium]
MDFLPLNDVPVLSASQKERMKNRIFQRLVSHHREESFFVRAAEFTREVQLGAVQKARLRERIFTAIALVSQKVPPFFIWKKFVSLAVLSTFMLFSFAVFQPLATFAREATTLQVLHGNAFVIRDGKTLSVRKEAILFEGDIIQTGASAEAVIQYFDNSFSRISGETKLELRRLFKDQKDSGMIVEVDLNAGKMWSRVFDLVSDSHFTVRAQSLIASVYHRATFSVSAEKQQSSVQVFHNAVEVKTSEISSAKPVTKGFQAVVALPSAQSSAIEKRATASASVEPLSLEKDERQWVEKNLAQDEQMIATTKASILEDKPLLDQTSLLLSFDPVEKSRVSFTVLNEKFSDPATTPAMKKEIFTGILALLTDIQTQSQALASTDSVKSQQLGALFGNISAFYKKDASPEMLSSLYETELRFAKDDHARAIALTEQAFAALSLGQDFSEQGKAEEAQKAFDSYKDFIAQASKLSASLPEKDVALDEKIQSSHQLFAAVNIPTVASRVSSEKLPGAVDTPVVASQVVPQQDTVVEAVHPVASETPVVPVVAEKVEKELLDPPDPKMIPPEVTLPKLELRKR